MKTTIELSAALLEEAKLLAARQGTTLRALIELGLRRVLDETEKAPAFRLRDGGFKGQGLQTGLDDASWERMRELAYESGER